ncbi:MAG: NTP transferase domain-containing protein [Thermoflexales bacterium]|nr:NTP transferase domain-containing protein [Thermoflexales bacterium]
MPESLPVFILVGGAGTRMGRQGEAPPKAMVEVGERPIVWHVMKIYAAFGHTDFVLALGYRGDWIRRYFLEYDTMTRPITLTLGPSAPVEFHTEQPEDNWRVTLFESGPVHTEKGSRLRKARPYIKTQTFFATYGDGVGDIDIDALLAFHRAHGKLATVTGVRPFSQYGLVDVSGEQVTGFRQKPQLEDWINAGFFVFEQGVFDYLPDGELVHLERETLPRLAADGQLMMCKHTGFWASMDTFKEAQWLTELWESGHAPWKVW